MRARPRSILLLLLAAYGGVLLLSTPAEVNGDGVGYLKQISGDGIAPGHLAYMPLLRALSAVIPHAVPLDLVLPLRLLGLACALLALGLLYDAALRLHGSTTAALFGTALLGLSHAFSRSATEVEVYAPAALLAVATLWALARHRVNPRPVWAVLAGLAAGAAVLLHLTLALLAVPLLLLSRPRLTHLVAGLSAMALAAGLPLALVLADHGSLASAWTWLRSADHGIADPHGPSAPLVALWGLARSLVYVPYPYERSLALVVPLSALAGAALLLLGLWAHRGRAALETRLLALWSAPLALFAVLFFPSDTERWIFVLPAVALCLAPAARAVSPRWIGALLGAMALTNIGLARIPAALDRQPLERARAAERLLVPGALLVSPGHGWDELVGLGMATPPDVYPLIYHVGAEGGLEPAIRLLQRRIRATLASGHPVFVARMGDRSDPRGFKELAWFGMDRGGFARLFEGYRAVPAGTPGLTRLLGSASR